MVSGTLRARKQEWVGEDGWGLGVPWGLSILCEIKVWVHKVNREVSRAVGVPAAVGSVEQEATLSKSLCQLPVKLPCLTAGLEVLGTEDSQQHAPGG